MEKTYDAMGEKVAHPEVAAKATGLAATGTGRDVTSAVFQVIPLGVLIFTVLWILRHTATQL